MTHDFDWSAAPPPWAWIGPEWREKCLRLAAEKPPLPQKRRRNRDEYGRRVASAAQVDAPT